MVEPQDRVLVLTINDHCCQVHSEDCPGIAPMKAGTLAGEEMCAKLPGLGQVRGQMQKVLRGSAITGQCSVHRVLSFSLLESAGRQSWGTGALREQCSVNRDESCAWSYSLMEETLK